MTIAPAIVCIAKLEGEYIEEWVKYHLALGFVHIFIYDNEDTPTYASQLQKYKDDITVIHAPGNKYPQGPIQYLILLHFVHSFFKCDITHITHIDIDEFIVLKKHANICDFIREYIKDDCAGIDMNLRLFGSSGLIEQSNQPITERFIMCESICDSHVKPIFDKRFFAGFNTCHEITPIAGYHIKSTTDIQINHYKCKTLPEFRRARSRGRADVTVQVDEDIDSIFHEFDKNETCDYTARDFYAKLSKVDASSL